MVNGSVINVDWQKPTLQFVKEGNTSYTPNMNLIEIPQPNIVSFPVLNQI
jgi:hypothetical protein